MLTIESRQKPGRDREEVNKNQIILVNILNSPEKGHLVGVRIQKDIGRACYQYPREVPG
jgi:hypothetical protein